VTGSTSKAVSVTVAKATPKVSVKLAKKTVKASQRARLTVTVRATGVTPTGRVAVYAGSKKLVTKSLTAAHKGKRTITLPRLTWGSHKIQVRYLGSSTVAKKNSSRVTLKVR